MCVWCTENVCKHLKLWDGLPTMLNSYLHVYIYGRYMVGESVSLLVWGGRKMDGGNCRNLKEGERV